MIVLGFFLFPELSSDMGSITSRCNLLQLLLLLIFPITITCFKCCNILQLLLQSHLLLLHVKVLCFAKESSVIIILCPEYVGYI